MACRQAGASLEERWEATPLHHAVAMGHAKAVRRLAAAGARLRRRDREGKSPATMAAERGDLELLRFLVDAAPQKREDSGAALRWAALSGHLAVLEPLSKSGMAMKWVLGPTKKPFETCLRGHHSCEHDVKTMQNDAVHP